MIRDLNIGFIGGCLITQGNITRENRFLYVLKNRIEKEINCRPVFHYSGYSDFYQLNYAYSKIRKNSKPDILILRIQTQPFLIMSKLLIRELNEYNKPKISLNPLLTGQRNIFKSKGIDPPEFCKRAKKPRLMKYNLMLGKLFRLDITASRIVLNAIFELYLTCLRNDIHLFLLGISPHPMILQGNNICRQFNTFMIKSIEEFGLDYIDTFDEMNFETYFQKDILYLSESGHEKMGELLYDGMYDYLNSYFNQDGFEG